MMMKNINASDPDVESYAMNGGDGSFSYNKNSSFQRSAIIAAKDIINKAIVENLDVTEIMFSSPIFPTFNITDMGCSVGPNTFIAVHNIIEAVRSKYGELQVWEFLVLFNDHVCNDFNTLFASLPAATEDRQHYYAAGVPGSFHSRLFPESSLHIVHSNSALQWLSQVPEPVLDNNSPAWNKGRVHYTSAPSEVGEAYSMQFNKDMAAFLSARAREVVRGGLMVLTLAGVPEGEPHSCYKAGLLFDLLGFCLMDMVMEGKISEAKVDLLNIPVYAASPSDMTKALDANGCFTVHRLELSFLGFQFSAETMTLTVRAALEGILMKHFGSEIIDELFDRYLKKAKENMSLVDLVSKGSSQLIVILKRK